jgi:hypothetical protein
MNLKHLLLQLRAPESAWALVAAAVLAAALLLALFVDALHTQIERGEQLRALQRSGSTVLATATTAEAR